MGRDNDETERVRKLLRSLSTYDLVLYVIERVFQRQPAIAARLKDESGALAKTRQKPGLISLFIEKIEFFRENSYKARELKLPSKTIDYVRYIDLLVTIQRSSYKTWQVYHLKNFKSSIAMESTIEAQANNLRIKINAWFAEHKLLCSCQVEFSNNQIWLLISFTKKTLDREKDKTRLGKSKFLYVVHFPGESYFYFAGSKVPHELGDAIAECMDSSGYIYIPLQGKHIESLRLLRLNRESSGSKQDVIAKDPYKSRFSTIAKPNCDQEHPKLDRLTTESNFDFRGLEDLPNPQEMAGKKTKLRLECRGTDIIGGLNELAAAGVIESQWLSRLPTAGRNTLSIVKGSSKETDFDHQSVFSMLSGVNE